MLIVLLDEPGLFVFSTLEEAVREIEPIDAEREVRAAFDEAAIPYRVEPTAEAPSKGLLGLLACGTESYSFVPCGPPDPTGLRDLLRAHPDYVDPPEAEQMLKKLRASLQAD